MSSTDFALAESVSTTNASYFLLVYLLILIYCCFGLAVVCDVYFVPALQKLSYTYDLPPDIAGSTLMALGASVPELFSSLIGVFVTEDDIGTGSIIGSSCFNLIAVPAACAFVASATFGRKLSISPVPVIRNSAFYAITILVLLLIIKDNKVDIPEAIILLLFFVMYMAFMIFCAQSSKSSFDSLPNSLTSSYISTDSAIAECSEKPSATSNSHHIISNNNINSNSNSDNNNNNNNNNNVIQEYCQHHQHAYGQFYFDNFNSPSNDIISSSVNETTPLVNNSSKKSPSCQLNCLQIGQQQQQSTVLNKSGNNLTDSVSINLGFAVKNSTCLAKSLRDECADRDPLGVGKPRPGSGADHFDEHGESWLNSQWILVPMLPVTLSLRVLTPLKFKNTCWTVWTFLVSIALIGGLTYLSVWMVHLFGQTVGLPETVAGMTILSWGTGIPELIASIVLIKKTAQADMAICNTIGSNVIDASFCLSVPWIVKCLLNRAAGLEPFVEIQSAALPWTSFTLLVAVVLLIVILKCHNWELGTSVGVWLMLTYLTFVVVATYLESSFSQSGLDLLSII